MIYYRRYVGDYLRDTSRLSILEHGAYNLLLDYYYAEERPIPADLNEVYRMVRALLPEERRAIYKVLTTFFFKVGDGYRHKRVDKEIAVSQQARLNGKNGGRPRTGELTGFETGIGTGIETEEETEEWGGSGHPSTTNHQPPEFNHQPSLKDGGKPSAIPLCPHAEILKLYAKHLPMGRQVRPPWKGGRAASLAARWKELPERRNLQWWDQFFEHCAESRFLTGRVPPRHPSGKPFEISMDWIVELSNFQEIVEGKYDD